MSEDQKRKIIANWMKERIARGLSTNGVEFSQLMQDIATYKPRGQ